MNYNIYFLLGNIIGVPLIGVRRWRHQRYYVCMHILHFHIVTEKKNDHSGWVPWSKKKFLHIRVYMYYFFFLLFCSVNRQNTYKSENKKNFGLQRKTLIRQRRIETEALPYGKYNVRSTFVGFLCFLKM